MSFARKTIVHLLIVGLLAATAASIASGIEVWPICNYPMFSAIPRRGGTEDRPRTSAKLVVVHADGSEHPYPTERPVLYREFDAYSANITLRPLLRRGAVDRAKLEAFLSLLLEGLERSAPTAAERPAALRLYVVRREARAPGGPPPAKERRLLLEVSAKDRR